MLENIEFLDDSTRPEAPTFTDLKPTQRAPGKHLAMIHNHYRQNMQTVRQALDDAKAGKLTASEVKERFEALDMVQNYRRFGALCGHYCQMVETHHTIEDQAIFPQLRTKSAVFQKVVDRLAAEHKIVHELLVRLSSILQALIANPNPAAFKDAETVFAKLETVLSSHFNYEEKSIGDALGYYNIRI